MVPQKDLQALVSAHWVRDPGYFTSHCDNRTLPLRLQNPRGHRHQEQRLRQSWHHRHNSRLHLLEGSLQVIESGACNRKDIYSHLFHKGKYHCVADLEFDWI